MAYLNRRRRMATGLLVLTAFWQGEMYAGETEIAKLYDGHKVVPALGKAPSGKEVFLIDGKPSPLFWAYQTLGDARYTRAGFNTVYHEAYLPSDGRPIEAYFDQWDKELLEIKERGYWAIIYIHNSVHAGAGEKSFRFDPKWKETVQKIVKRYAPVTNLIGWAFSDEVGDMLAYPDEEFRKFLQTQYADIATLNKFWGTSHTSFDQITLEYQRNHLGRPEASMAMPSAPFGVGPKAFDSAKFKLSHVAYAHEEFEKAVRQIDPVTPLFSGAHNLGWALSATPNNWFVYPDPYPQYTGGDFETHHVWTIDISRGNNQRAGLPIFMIERDTGEQWRLDARIWQGWMLMAAMHGSSGEGFWPWKFLGLDDHADQRSASVQRIDACEQTIKALQESDILNCLPKTSIAVIYQGYAEGWGNMSQVWGVLREPDGEPLQLMSELRYGTRYGQADYLTHLSDDAADYEHYGVIIAQFTPDLTPQQVAALQKYVEEGGVLLADVGFDCMRAGKVITGLTPEAAALFGISELKVSSAVPGAWKVTGQGTELFKGLKVSDSSVLVTRFLLDVTPTTATAVLKGPGGQGLYVNKVGKGYALFGSGLVWGQGPTSKDPLWRAIHESLFSRRAQIQVVSAPAQQRDGEAPAYTESYQVALFADAEGKDAYALQNRLERPVSIKVKTASGLHSHDLNEREIIFVRGGKIYRLGEGSPKVELGPGKLRVPLAPPEIQASGTGPFEFTWDLQKEGFLEKFAWATVRDFTIREFAEDNGTRYLVVSGLPQDYKGQAQDYGQVTWHFDAGDHRQFTSDVKVKASMILFPGTGEASSMRVEFSTTGKPGDFHTIKKINGTQQQTVISDQEFSLQPLGYKGSRHLYIRFVIDKRGGDFYAAQLFRSQKDASPAFSVRANVIKE